jgi:predicted component of type VI protein secretion system
MKLSLTVLTAGKKKGLTIPIQMAEFLIGRGKACNLRPKSPVFSDRHCALRIRDGRVFVRDLGSANGTYVNHKKIAEEVELHHEDRLRVGFLSFGIQIEGGAPQQTGISPSMASPEVASPALHLDAEMGLVSIEEESPAAPIQPAAVERPVPAKVSAAAIESFDLASLDDTQVPADPDAFTLEALSAESDLEEMPDAEEPEEPDTEQFNFVAPLEPAKGKAPSNESHHVSDAELFNFE